VRESLRLPTTLAGAARGLDLSRNEVAVVLQRSTADQPYRAGADRGNPTDGTRVGMTDAEPGLERDVTLPAAREFQLGGWASVAPTAPDDALDRLAGMPSEWRLRSSSRFEGVPSRRASSAFDAALGTEWVGDLTRGTVPWLSWRGPRAVRVERLTLAAGSAPYSRPTQVRVSAPGSARRIVRVGGDGSVVLPRPIRTRELKIEILRTARPENAFQRLRRLNAVAVAEVTVPGLEVPRARASGPFATRCGEIAVSASGSRAGARVVGDIERLDQGLPLRLESCASGGTLALPAGESAVSAPPGAVMRPDHLLLRSAPAQPAASAARPEVTKVGSMERGVPQDAELRVPGEGWLVLGESYAAGWRATCEDAGGGERDLGEPVPIDGYANGWPVDGSCTRASFAFAPQSAANIAYVISGLALLAMLLVAVLGARRRLPAAAQPAEPDESRLAARIADPLRKFDWRVALAAGVLVGVIGGLCFALRVGGVIGPATFVLLLVGVNARRLFTAGGVLLALVVLLYLLDPAADPGGYGFFYAEHHMNAHWLAVGAIWCIAGGSLIAALSLRDARRREEAPT
jgi:hypothetical protein